MHVCYVTTSYIRSRADYYSRFVYEQTKSLLRVSDAHRATVVAPHAAGLAGSEQIDGIQVRRFRYFLPQRAQVLAYQNEGLFQTLKSSLLAVINLPFFLLAMAVLLWRCSRGSDLIHAQWLPTAAVALPVAALRRIPLVVSIRGADINTAMGSNFGRWVSRFLLQRVDFIVTVSDEFRGVLVNELAISTPVAALYNGVDIEQCQPLNRTACREQVGLPTDRPIVLYVGGLIQRKGVDTLLRAFAQVARSRPDVALSIVGEGPEEDKLKALCGELGLWGRVSFHGSVSKDATHLWMAASDVLVLASYSEGRPNVVLEAMACALPVIATNVNGTRELIDDGGTGLMFEPGDVDGLASRLASVLEQPQRCGELGTAARQSILDRGLTWQAHGERLVDIYCGLTGAGE